MRFDLLRSLVPLSVFFPSQHFLLTSFTTLNTQSALKDTAVSSIEFLPGAWPDRPEKSLAVSNRLHSSPFLFANRLKTSLLSALVHSSLACQELACVSSRESATTADESEERADCLLPTLKDPQARYSLHYEKNRRSTHN